MKNRRAGLEKWTGHKAGGAISDAQLRGVAGGVDWQAYNSINQQHFAVNVSELSDNEWVAIDGKELRGALEVSPDDGKKAKRGEVVANTVRHGNREVAAQTYYRGDKESEKAHVRNLLGQTGPASGSTAMDALHCNPKTTGLVENLGGRYMVQAKEGQKALMEELRLSARSLPCLYDHTDVDKGHGRVEKRHTGYFALKGR